VIIKGGSALSLALCASKTRTAKAGGESGGGGKTAPVKEKAISVIYQKLKERKKDSMRKL